MIAARGACRGVEAASKEDVRQVSEYRGAVDRLVWVGELLRALSRCM